MRCYYNITGTPYLVILLYNNIPKVLLYCEVFLQKNNFKGVFVLVYTVTDMSDAFFPVM